MSDLLKRLMKRLDYQFQERSLLMQALTHCSAGEMNNERLEFLGDSILSMIIAEKLYQLFPSHSEGQLSRLRAYLVKGETLAILAKELELGDNLILGQGEMKSGGFRRASILADSFEAVLAAIYLDGGLKAVKTVILHLYDSRLRSSDLETQLKDHKTQLQELLQSKRKPLPVYELTRISGECHSQTFEVKCHVPGIKLSGAQGMGMTRRKAEQAAAKAYLKLYQASKLHG